MRPSLLRHASLSLLIATALSGCASAPEPAATAAPAPPAAAAAVVDTGEIAGAPYRIERPAAWNGELVVYLHGYEPQGWPRDQITEQDDLDRWLLGQGFAVARSGYSSQGWAVAEALVDTEAVRARFVERHGAPRRSYLIGHSMGAHLVLATLERHPETYSGGLALCGANAPASELFGDMLLSPLVAFDYFFPGVMGLPAGGLADPAAPPFIDEAVLEAALKGNETVAQRLSARYDIPREGLAGGLMIRYIVLNEMARRAGGFPADNRTVRYDGLGDDAAVNAGVRRYAGDPKAIAYAAANAPLRGDTRRPVVLLANHKDPTVPTAISSRYVALAGQAGQAGNVLALPPQGEGHCAFAPEAVTTAFDTLRRWVDDGRRPAP
jgi:pimeloyl-ACP methyl ester carboxylesterase